MPHLNPSIDPVSIPSKVNSRRTFLATTAAGIGYWFAGTAPRVCHGTTRADTLRIAVIGLGPQGNGHLKRYLALPNVEIAYLCDVDQGRLGAASKVADKAKTVTDLRRVLDDPSVDAVSIATPDHWHAPAAILACAAGKHVYVEKPCSHNFQEGRWLVEAARRHGRVVQHGTQTRSSQSTANAIQLLREGIIGDVFVAKAWNVQRRNNIGKEKPSDPPAGFDYDLWLGPAPHVPFQKNRHHYNWHWWYDFGTGDMGNDGVHELDYARWGLGVTGFPHRIFSIGGKFYFDDDQQFPDTQMAVFEYEGSGKFGSKRQLIFEMRLWSKNYPFNADSGVEFYGTQGRMLLSKRGKLEIYGDDNKSMPVPKPKNPVQLITESHQEDFLNCIRTGGVPQADIELGLHSAALCHFGNMATRLGRQLNFNTMLQKIDNDVEANQLLGRTYRENHWSVPKSTT